WVKFHAPQGVPVKASEAPELFAALEDIRRRTRGPKANAVLITQEFNAAIVQVPRLGVFGWHKNYVLLGLPLMQALSADEVKAVIAHEYGHLAGAHGKLSGWIYRIRSTWAKLSGAFETGGIAFVLKRFFNWYGPWFNAYSFVLARADEYEADRCSVDVAGKAAAASALTRVSVEGHRFSQHWSELYHQSQHRPEPELLAYKALAVRFSEAANAEDYRFAVTQALKEATDIHDTHPCLSDRLKAIGEGVPELQPVGVSGAEALLGAELSGRLTEKFDMEWWQEMGPAWQENYEKARERFQRREALLAVTDLGREEAQELIDLHEHFNDIPLAIDVAEVWAATHPDDEIMCLILWRLYLETGDRRGLEGMTQALNKAGHEDRLQMLAAMVTFYERYAQDDAGHAEADRQLAEALKFQNHIQNRFSRLEPSVPLESADLNDEVRAKIADIAAQSTIIRSLWIAQRRLPEEPSVCQFVALYVCRSDQTSMVQKEMFMDEVLAQLQPQGYAMIVEQSRDRDWLKKTIRAISGSHLYGS
ncbi:MAG: hypothetical protein B7Z26_06750, partial [Asticcacaulis sp. 32-58-5]